MHEYIQSPQYYSFAEIAWTVYDKYFVSNNPIFLYQRKKEICFPSVCWKQKQKPWIMVLNKEQLTFAVLIVAISFKLRVVNTYPAYQERYLKVFYIEMIK